MIAAQIKLNWFCDSFNTYVSLVLKMKPMQWTNLHFLRSANLNFWSKRNE